MAVWRDVAPENGLRDDEGGEEGMYDGRPSWRRIGSEAL